MKLYDNPASPFCRKVMILLAETGQEDEVEIVKVAGHPTDKGTMPVDLNPLGKIPALERADGPVLYDSPVICRFLDDRAGAGLYPAPPRLWDVLTLEATADGILDAAVLMVYESRSRPEEKRYGAWVEGQWAKITRALDVIEARWMAHLQGKFDIGHVAVASALGYLDFRHPDRDWRAGRGSLPAWFESISERPSIAATVPHA